MLLDKPSMVCNCSYKWEIKKHVACTIIEENIFEVPTIVPNLDRQEEIGVSFGVLQISILNTNFVILQPQNI
jgi:hypothetical protein